jgi:hypothetical protein
MAKITSSREQRDTASAARKVGGYSELVRLAAEQRKHGKSSSVSRDSETGQYHVKAMSR